MRLLSSGSAHTQTLDLIRCRLREVPSAITALTSMVSCDLSANFAMVCTL